MKSLNFDMSAWGLRLAFEQTIQRASRQPVRFRWHQNRYTMISIAPMDPMGWKISLHAGFDSAPVDVRRALSTYLNTRRRDAWATVRQYAETIPVPARREAIRCRTKGTQHDLEDIQQQVEHQFFEGQSLAKISWKTYRKHRTKRTRRSIRYGQYDPTENLILINDLLDQPKVPREFVEYIIYHETLHVLHPPVRHGRRTVYHHAEFRRQERQFPNFLRMQILSAELLQQLD